MTKTCMLCRTPIGRHDLRYMLPSYRNLDLFWAWVKASANPDLWKYPAQVLAKRQLMVCGLHFHPKDFVKLGKLRSDAVPTLCLPKLVDVGDVVIDLPESDDTQTIEVQLGHFPDLNGGDSEVFSSTKSESTLEKPAVNNKKVHLPMVEEKPDIHKQSFVFLPPQTSGSCKKSKLDQQLTSDCSQSSSKFFRYDLDNILTYSSKKVNDQQSAKTYFSSFQRTDSVTPNKVRTANSGRLVARAKMERRKPIAAPPGDSLRQVVSDEVILSQNSYCRICLKVIFEDPTCLLFNSREELSEGLQTKLKEVYPEIDLQLTPDPVICLCCFDLLDYAYKFKKLATTTEARLKTLHPTQLFPASLTPKPTNQRLSRKPKETPISLEDLITKMAGTGDIMDSSLDEYFTQKAAGTMLQRAANVVFESKPQKWQMGPWLCQICGKFFTKRAHLNKHVTPDRQKTFVCDICGIVKDTPQSFYYHRSQHLGTEFQCDQCTKKFSKISYLQRHLDNAHPRSGIQYQCEQCGKVFFTKVQFKHHLMNHKAQRMRKPSKCGECGKVFVFGTNMKRHMLKHAKDFYSCEVCGKRIKRLKSLDRHVKLMHHNESEFKCEICNKGFWKKITLIEHNIKLHGGEPKKCLPDLPENS